MRRVLITGAAGRIGRTLRAGLAGDYELRLLDIAAQESAGAGEEIVTADVADQGAVQEALAGVDSVVHLAAIPTEASFDDLARNNIVATYSLFEGARRAGVPRVVFASTNHVTGFYPRTHSIRPDVPIRPDTLYGVSKAFGEALGRLYHDKFGLEIACLRIGAFTERPTQPIHLSTWLSPRDCVQLVRCCLDAPKLGFVIVYGVSANRRSWWIDDTAERLGYRPLDDAESHAEAVGTVTAGGLADTFQGGRYVEFGLGRTDASD